MNGNEWVNAMVKWNERSDIESWSEEDDVSERDDDTESFTYQSWTRKSRKSRGYFNKESERIYVNLESSCHFIEEKCISKTDPKKNTFEDLL